MACRAMECWTLTSLVGAYLDLALAYLFLAGATIAFFASKFLILFGLSLPCSCDGRFGHPACTQTSLLVGFPASRLASVHRSVRSRFPFDTLLPTGATSSPGSRHDVRYPREDGDSCCSVSPLSSRPRSHSTPAPLLPSDPTTHESLFHLNRVRPRSIVGDLISDHEKPFSASGERISSGTWDSGDDGFAEVAEAGEEKVSLSGVLERDGEVSLATRSLERELEKEREARAALYLELEKERSAASSAADEAMAMILRLQKEKAEIDMESRQYQRMIEEKYAYDVEEMGILKEIIVRREREKLVLEKEVQMYKQMVNSGGNVEHTSDTDDSFLEDKLDTLVDSSDDPMLMLQQIYKSIGKKGFGVESSTRWNSSRVCSNHDKFVDGKKHVESFNTLVDSDHEFQEKNVLTTMSKLSYSDNLNSVCAKDSVLYKLDAPFEEEYLKDITDLSVRDLVGSNIMFETVHPSEGLLKVGSHDTEKIFSDLAQLEANSSIHDVPVIDDGKILQIKDDNNQIFIKESCPNFDEVELNIRRSCSEITNRISLIDSLSGRASYFNLRSSLPSVEIERFKLENEVEGLRKRLEIIRQGRENLSFYADQKEKETFQLQLLDEITHQLKEIKKVTEPNKSLHRVSLPAPSSKFKVNK